jgi:hypothetical protein
MRLLIAGEARDTGRRAASAENPMFVVEVIDDGHASVSRVIPRTCALARSVFAHRAVASNQGIWMNHGL